MHIKNIIFDSGGVILDINMQKTIDGFAALGLPQNELRFDVGETADLMHRYQLGHFATDEFCRLVAAKCNPGTTPEQVALAWNSICLGIPERKLNAIKALKQRANAYLLSNTNDLHWQYCLDHWFNANGNRCEDFFDKVFLSQNMHLEKPYSEIFEQVIKVTGTDAIFLDDNLDNVNAAKNCGIQAVQITPDFDWFDYLKALD